jgi:hypothetical protein
VGVSCRLDSFTAEVTVATWDSLCTYIDSHYKVSERQPDQVQLRFQVDSSRTQLVLVLRKEFNQEEWVELTTPVAPAEEVDPRTALEYNASLVVGALALVEDTLVLKFSLRLADLDPDEFNVPLSVLVHTGDVLEEKFTGKDVY